MEQEEVRKGRVDESPTVSNAVICDIAGFAEDSWSPVDIWSRRHQPTFPSVTSWDYDVIITTCRAAGERKKIRKRQVCQIKFLLVLSLVIDHVKPRRFQFCCVSV